MNKLSPFTFYLSPENKEGQALIDPNDIHKSILNDFNIKQDEIATYDINESFLEIQKYKKGKWFYFLVVTAILWLVSGSYFIVKELSADYSKMFKENERVMSIENSVNFTLNLSARAENLRQENLSLKDNLNKEIKTIKNIADTKVKKIRVSDLDRKEKQTQIKVVYDKMNTDIKDVKESYGKKITTNDSELKNISKEIVTQNKNLDQVNKKIKDVNPDYFKSLKTKTETIEKQNDVKQNIYTIKSEIADHTIENAKPNKEMQELAKKVENIEKTNKAIIQATPQAINTTIAQGSSEPTVRIVERVVEKIVRVPVEKIVRVPAKVVEKIVKVPVEKIVEVPVDNSTTTIQQQKYVNVVRDIGQEDGYVLEVDMKTKKVIVFFNNSANVHLNDIAFVLNKNGDIIAKIKITSLNDKEGQKANAEIISSSNKIYKDYILLLESKKR